MLEIRPRIDIGGGEPGGPAQFSAEVRYGVPGTRMFAEAYEPATAERFADTLETYAKNEAGQDGQQGVFFSTFNTTSDHDVQVTFSWLEPEARAPAEDGWQFAGSMLFSQSTDEGERVLSYSLFEGPGGRIIEGQAGKYSGPAPVEALAVGGHIQPGADYQSIHNEYQDGLPGNYMPGITNDELNQAMDLASDNIGSRASAETGTMAAIAGAPAGNEAAGPGPGAGSASEA